jgi:hypothetical protein
MGDPAGLDSAFAVEAELFCRKRFSAASELLARKLRLRKFIKSANRLSPSRPEFILTDVLAL